MKLFLATLLSAAAMSAAPITIDTGSFTFSNFGCLLAANETCIGPTDSATGASLIISDNAIYNAGPEAVLTFQVTQDGGWSINPAVTVSLPYDFTGLGIGYTTVTVYRAGHAPESETAYTYADWSNMQFPAMAMTGNDPLNVAITMYFAVNAPQMPGDIQVSIAPGSIAPEPFTIILIGVPLTILLFLKWKEEL